MVSNVLIQSNLTLSFYQDVRSICPNTLFCWNKALSVRSDQQGHVMQAKGMRVVHTQYRPDAGVAYQDTEPLEGTPARHRHFSRGRLGARYSDIPSG